MQNYSTSGFFKVLGIVAVVFFLVLVLADCTVVRQQEFTEGTLVRVQGASSLGVDGEVHFRIEGATFEDSDGFTHYTNISARTLGQLQPGNRVRVLRTRGSLFGWFSRWYLIKKVGG